MSDVPTRADAAPIRVFLVDDHEVVLDGLRLLIGAQPDLVAVGEAATAEAARRRVIELRPDVAVIDLNLPDGDGATLCREVRELCDSVRCIVLTADAADDALLDAADAGADAFLTKTVRATDLGAAIREVAAGRPLLDRAMVDDAVERKGSTGASKPDLRNLSAREMEVLELLGEGLSNRQIADRLYLAEKTVKNYVSNVLMKLGLQRRSEAAILMVRREGRRSGRSAVAL